MSGTTPPRCRDCSHFRNDPAFMEAAVPGLASFGSGWASVSGEDGLCLWHDRHVGARNGCAEFAPVARAA
jgi:hypothetical protein